MRRHGPCVEPRSERYGGARARRAALADRYIYQVAIEAFFIRAMRGRLDAAAKRRLRDAGIAVDEPLLSVYPAEVFHRGVA